MSDELPPLVPCENHERIMAMQDDIDRNSYYAHGRGWWFRLVAWIGLCVVVGFLFYRQELVLDEIVEQRTGACQAVVYAYWFSEELAEAGIRPVIPVDPTIDPRVALYLTASRDATADANARRLTVIAQAQAAHRALEASEFCGEFGAHPEAPELPR